MADDIKLNIGVVGLKDLREAANEIVKTGNASRTLAAQFKPLGAQTTRYVQETKRLARELKALRAAEAQQIIGKQDLARAEAEVTRKAQERILTDKTLTAQAKKAAKAEDDRKKRVQQLTRAYAPARVAADEYRRTVKEIRTAQKQNIITAKEMETALARVSREYKQFTAGVATGGNQFARFNVTAYNTAQTFKRQFNTGMQQAGYQVGDFFVQIQSGQSAMVALGQQGSQLAGIFGPKGAVVGGLLAIGTAAITMYQQTTQAFKDVEEATDAIKTAFDELEGITETLELSILDNSKAFSGLSEDLREFLGVIRDIKQERLQEALGTVSSDLITTKRIGSRKKLSELGVEPPTGGPNFRSASKLRESMTVSVGMVEGMGLFGADQVKAAQIIQENLKGATSEELAKNFIVMTTELGKSGLLTKELSEKLEDVQNQLGITVTLNKLLKDDQDSYNTNLQRGLDFLEKQKEASKELAKAAQEIKDETKEQEYALRDKSILLRLERQYGKDSVEVAAEISFQEERAFRQRMMSKGILGNNLRLVMDAYRAVELQKRKLDEQLKAEKEKEAILKRQVATMKLAYEFMEKQATAAQTLKEAVEAIESNISTETSSLQDRLRLAETELEFGKDSVELSRLNAELAREAFIARAMEQGILGNNLETLLALYDKVAAAEGRIPKTTKGRGKTDAEKVAEYIKSLENQRDKEKQLRGIFDEQRDLMGSLIDARQKYGDIASESQMKTIEGYIQETHALEQQQKALEEAKKQQEQLKETISSSMEDAFMSIVDGTKSVEDAFKDMARQIIAELYRVLVVKKMVAAATSFFGFADGGVFSNGNVVPFANGGVVGSPTYFPMSGGRTGLMGEAGPEAIMPLKRGKNGKLGVEASGQGDNITISQTFNFAANGDESVKRIIVKSMPQITEAAKAGVLDARKRGGSFRKVFS